MNELALFSGAGGGLLASRLLGWNTVCACELEKYPRERVLDRQRDGHLDRFPIWDNVCTFEGKPWRGKVDVISGGFPCQDISAAGKGAGITGDRSGLWKEYARIIGEVRPRFVFAENSPLLRTRGLGVVLQDLDSMGYDARWGVLGAGHFGALHKRSRMWVLGYPRGSARERTTRGLFEEEAGVGVAGEQHGHLPVRPEHAGQGSRKGPSRLTSEDASGLASDAQNFRREQEPENAPGGTERDTKEGLPARPTNSNSRVGGYLRQSWWGIEPGMGRVAHGVADRVDRTKAIGNGQVPLVAVSAWNILSAGLTT